MKTTALATEAKPALTNIDTEVPFTLDATDRCDRCGAQAYVAAALTRSVLLFCAHHSHEHMPKLLADGVSIIADNTDRLYASEGASRSVGDAHA